MIDLEDEMKVKENMFVSVDVFVVLEKKILIILIEVVNMDKVDKYYVYIVDVNK